MPQPSTAEPYTINIPVKPINEIRAHPNMRPRAFARLLRILSGAAETSALMMLVFIVFA
jgi:hypothetical protein